MEDLVGNLTDNSELKKGKQAKGEKTPKGTEMAPREEEVLSDEDPFDMGYDSSGSDSTDDGMTDAR